MRNILNALVGPEGVLEVNGFKPLNCLTSFLPSTQFRHAQGVMANLCGEAA